MAQHAEVNAADVPALARLLWEAKALEAVEPRAHRQLLDGQRLKGMFFSIREGNEPLEVIRVHSPPGAEDRLLAELARYRQALTFLEAAEEQLKKQSADALSKAWAWFEGKAGKAQVGPYGEITAEQLIKTLAERRADIERMELLRKLGRTMTHGFATRTDPLAPAGREKIPESVRREVWNRDGGRCVRCQNNQKLEFDHVIPIARGGSNTARNLQLLCELCNRSKGTNV